MEEKSHRKVVYADKQVLEENIINQDSNFDKDNENMKSKGGGISSNPSSETEVTSKKTRPTLRT